jgi:hypothetical protein
MASLKKAGPGKSLPRAPHLQTFDRRFPLFATQQKSRAASERTEFEHPAGILKRKFEGFGQIFCH